MLDVKELWNLVFYTIVVVKINMLNIELLSFTFKELYARTLSLNSVQNLKDNEIEKIR